jgi:hypothetical protein
MLRTADKMHDAQPVTEPICSALGLAWFANVLMVDVRVGTPGRDESSLGSEGKEFVCGIELICR